jgi:hypothetical protein
MKVRVFTVRFDRETGAFDDTALQQFLETHDATAVSEHVVTVDGEPTLLLMVQWRPSGPVCSTIRLSPTRRTRSPSWPALSPSR